MRVEQISIFLENKTGRIAEITKILADANVNIRALSLADTSDFGVLRLIVDNNQAAEAALKQHGITMGKTSVVAVEVEDTPGGLFRIMSMIADASLNVEYMYAFIHPKTTHAVMIFKFDKLDEAVDVLRQNNVTVIEATKVHSL